MGVLSDGRIRQLCQGEEPMIEPYSEPRTGDGIVSFGLSSYGYDIRLGREFKIFQSVMPQPTTPGQPEALVVDPKRMRPELLQDHVGPHCVIPSNSFVLGRSLEHFRIPRGVLGICLGKSTYARCGIIVNLTPLEPEWEGHLTIEISNTTPHPAVVYAEEGIAQVVFLTAAGTRKERVYCETSYADKRGKYQHQGGTPVPARVE